MSINADVDGYVAEDPRDSLDDGATQYYRRSWKKDVISRT